MLENNIKKGTVNVEKNVLLFALRYSLGRLSYAKSIVINAIKNKGIQL